MAGLVAAEGLFYDRIYASWILSRSSESRECFVYCKNHAKNRFLFI